MIVDIVPNPELLPFGKTGSSLSYITSFQSDARSGTLGLMLMHSKLEILLEEEKSIQYASLTAYTLTNRFSNASSGGTCDLFFIFFSIILFLFIYHTERALIPVKIAGQYTQRNHQSIFDEKEASNLLIPQHYYKENVILCL
ncbi:MAG: hypothetical protein EZS28_001235 [Streblomastix strix]|uniref:Uncharacterized protein n=1 Tax=Streblomastix strix TaxID=222440 RepID=A0A5J4X9P9_9EUKA|nr:MAG: hypothetical protein EZS28_001235 [Streblomastix strix]